MGFLDQVSKILKPHPDQYTQASDLIGRFDPVDEKVLAESGGAVLSFIREHCIRGNARKFQICLDGKPIEKISLDSQCSIFCEPGFHKLHVKLDSLTSPVLNVKAEAGQRYYFDIACTMNEGMILQRIEEE